MFMKLDQNDVLMKKSLFFWNKKSIFWFVKDADEIQKKTHWNYRVSMIRSRFQR